jgi:hypothetical protein
MAWEDSYITFDYEPIVVISDDPQDFPTNNTVDESIE